MRIEGGGAVTTWAYDTASQLISEWRRDGNISTFSYDPAGNRTLLEEQVGASVQLTTSVYDLASQLVTETTGDTVLTHTFDANGKWESVESPEDGTTTYTWDARDRLLQVEPASGIYAVYTYRPDNLRATVDVDEGLLKQVWDLPGFTGFGDLFEELDSGDDFKRAYYRAQRLVTQQEAGQGYVSLQTDLGSTQRLVDDGEDTQLAVEYSAWGQQVAASGAATTPLRGNGEWGYYTDVGATTPIWVRERYLEAGRGRWMSADPIGFAGGPNLYGYVGNRPTEFDDPDGLILPWVAGALVAGGTGAVIGGAIGAFRAYRHGAHGWDVAAAFGRGALVGGAAGLAAFGVGEFLTLFGGAGVAAGLLRAAATGLVSDAVTQQLEIKLGCRTEFDWWEFGLSAATGIASFGLGRLPLWWSRNRIAPDVRPVLLGLRPGPTNRMTPWFYLRPPRGLGLRPTAKILLEQMPGDFLDAVEEPRALHFTLEGFSVRRFLQYARIQDKPAILDQNWTNFEAQHLLLHPTVWPKVYLHNIRLLRW
jgi:RHS repeat-associated protein